MEQRDRKNTTEYVIQSTREYLDSIFVEERLIDSGVPSLEMELFGETFSSPIMTPAFSHMKNCAPGQQDGCKGVVDYVTKMNDELRMMMAFTGFRKTTEIEDSVLWM